MTKRLDELADDWCNKQWPPTPDKDYEKLYSSHWMSSREGFKAGYAAAVKDAQVLVDALIFYSEEGLYGALCVDEDESSTRAWIGTVIELDRGEKGKEILKYWKKIQE